MLILKRSHDIHMYVMGSIILELPYRSRMNNINPFIGRRKDLEQLRILYARRASSLAVIKGRRRIGKSRLVTEFAQTTLNHQKKQPTFYSFAGLAPKEGVTPQTQRDHFGRTLANKLKIPPMTFLDWTDAFQHLTHNLMPGDIILLDELSWMEAKDPTFISKLKDWWDTIVLEKSQVLLIFCSSVSIWIEDNILNNTAFFGRVALTLTLPPLNIPESKEVLISFGFNGSVFEFYKLLSVFGGVPWYLEQVDNKNMADENIKRLCFQKDALLVLEFNRIFHDLFNGKGIIHKKILESLKMGMKTLAEIRQDIQAAQGGMLSNWMSHLTECGFVQEHTQWRFKEEKLSKQSLYRISDPYIRFYLKYIEPNRAKIDLGAFDDVAIQQIPGFDTHIGLQVENLLLQNRKLLLKTIGINPSEVSFDGPYRQTKTTRSKGCQIDYLIQTRSKNLFLCEFKFKRKELGSEIIEEVKEKMARLSIPRGFAVVPVLFHVGGVLESVYDKQYFYRIVDISDLLEANS